MSDRDSFIDEVSEEVRRDRMFALWKRFGPFVIGGIVLIVAAAAVYTWLEDRRAVDAQKAGGALIAASLGGAAETAEAMEVFANGADAGGAATLARLRAAGAHVLAGDRDAAIAAFEQVSLAADTRRWS